MHKIRLAVAAAAVAALAAPALARADTVTDWNGFANAAIVSTGPTAHSAVLSTAMVQGAVYDAVNAIAGGYQPYLSTPSADPMFSQDAAAATAAYLVAKNLVPSQAATLQAKYNASLAAIADGPAETGTPGSGASCRRCSSSTRPPGSATSSRSSCRTRQCSARAGRTR